MSQIGDLIRETFNLGNRHMLVVIGDNPPYPEENYFTVGKPWIIRHLPIVAARQKLLNLSEPGSTLEIELSENDKELFRTLVKRSPPVVLTEASPVACEPSPGRTNS